MLRFDIFPARAVIGDKVYAKARLLVHNDGRAVLWADQGSGAEIVARADGAAVRRERAKPRSVYIDQADVESWEVTRSGGCGCGGANSSLKRINRMEAFA